MPTKAISPTIELETIDEYLVFGTTGTCHSLMRNLRYIHVKVAALKACRIDGLARPTPEPLPQTFVLHFVTNE